MATPRETAAAKRARISLLLAMYDAKSRESRKLFKEVDELKSQIRELKPGVYGDWAYNLGTPREILDQKAAREALTKAGIPIPTKATDYPIVLTPVVKP